MGSGWQDNWQEPYKIIIPPYKIDLFKGDKSISWSIIILVLNKIWFIGHFKSIDCSSRLFLFEVTWEIKNFNQRSNIIYQKN